MALRRIVRMLGLAAWVGCTGPETGDDTDDTEVRDRGALLGIGIFPRDPSVAVGDQVTFVVKGFYEDTSNEVIGDVSWVSTEPRVAEVGADGVARALSPGVTSIVGTDSRGVSTKTDLTVRGDGSGPTEVRLSPRAIEVAVGGVVEVQAVGSFLDGTEGNVGSACTWAAEDPAIVSVEGAGSVRGLVEGRTTVRATCGALSASAPVAVRSADTPANLPDLEIGEVLWEVAGDELVVLLEVKNRGDGMSPLGFVDLFLDTDGTPMPGDTFVTTELVDPLGPGETGYVLLAYAGISAGDHQAWLWADADGWVEEADETNNVAGPFDFRVGGRKGPDLMIDLFDGLSDGLDTLWTVEVQNVGDEVARDFWIDVYANPSEDPELCDYGDASIWIAELAPGEVVAWEPELAEAPVDEGWLSVLWADSCGDVTESDETNNLDYVLIYP
jgi:hypothetical protein